MNTYQPLEVAKMIYDSSSVQEVFPEGLTVVIDRLNGLNEPALPYAGQLFAYPVDESFSSNRNFAVLVRILHDVFGEEAFLREGVKEFSKEYGFGINVEGILAKPFTDLVYLATIQSADSDSHRLVITLTGKLANFDDDEAYDEAEEVIKNAISIAVFNSLQET